MKKYLSLFLLVLVTLAFSCIAYAQGDVAEPTTVEPVLGIILMAIQFIKTAFPVAGPYIQGFVEIIASVSVFFTLLTAFVIGALKIPYVIAHVSGATDLAAKIQKFSDKIGYYLKKLSMFNAQNK